MSADTAKAAPYRGNRVRLRRHIGYAVAITIISVLASYPSILPFFRDVLQRYLRIGDREFGLLFSIGSIGGVVTVLLGGPLVDRWGPRRMLSICLLGTGAVMLLIGAAGAHWVVLAVALGLNSIVAGPLNIAMSAYLARLFPRHRRRVLSLNLAAQSAGGFMIAVLSEGWLGLTRAVPAVRFAYVLHVPFAVLGAVLVMVSRCWRPSRARRPVPHATPLFHWRTMAIPAPLLLLGVLLALHGAVDTTIYTWMPRFLASDSFGSHPIPPGFVLSGFSVAYLVSRVLLAMLPETRGRRTLMILPGLLGGSVLIAGILSRQFWFTAGGYVLAAFLWSAEYPAMLSMVARRGAKSFGAVMAVAGVLSAILTFGLLNLAGWTAEHLGEARMWQAMLVPACGFPLVGLGGALWVALYGRERHRRPSS